MNNVAQTIIEQLGGNRFAAMTGAKDFVDVGAGQDSDYQYLGGLMFRIGRGAKNRANKVCVKLAANDTYRLYFFNIRGVTVKDCGTVENVYADNLARVFTEQTGFDTRF